MSGMNVKFRRPQKTDKTIDFNTAVRMQEVLESLANMSFSQDFTVSYGTNIRIMLTAGSGTAGLDMSNIDFGYEITDSILRKVSLNAGVFRIGQTQHTVAAYTGMVINNSPSYVYLEYPRNGTPIIQAPTSSISTTLPDANAYRHLLYTFTISNSGGLNDPSIHHLGAVQVGAYWT